MRLMFLHPVRTVLSKQPRAFWFKRGGLLSLLLCSMVFGVVSVSGNAQAATGCEHDHVAQGYRCIVEVGAGACLRERNVTTFASEACVPRGTIVYVVRQVRLTDHMVSGSAIWDLLTNGRMVSDYYVNTGHSHAFSPPIPNPTTKPTPTATARATATQTPTGTPTPGGAPSGTPFTPGSYDAVNSRLFSNSSPWNVPIGSNVQLDPHSQEMVNLIATGQSHVPAMFDYGMPIYTATASDPSYTVHDTTNDPLFLHEQPIPIPDSAAPSPGSDHWLFIYDQTRNLLFEMWQAHKSGTTWSTNTGDVYSPTGDGVLQTDGSPQSGNGASYFGGVITAADMQRGFINHALSLASQYTSSSFRYPMVASDGHTPGGISMGARLQLDPAVDCTTLPGASRGEQMVCQALQTYGGYLRDTGGVALSAYFEGENLADPARHPPGGSPGNTGSSTGPFGAVRLSDGQELSAIPWEKLRVLASWNSFTPVTSTPSAHTSGVVLATPASLVSLEVAEHNEQEQARWDGGWTNVLVDPRSVWEIWRRR